MATQAGVGMRLDGAALCGLCEPLLRESATSGRAKFVKVRQSPVKNG